MHELVFQAREQTIKTTFNIQNKGVELGLKLMAVQFPSLQTYSIDITFTCTIIKAILIRTTRVHNNPNINYYAITKIKHISEQNSGNILSTITSQLEEVV